MKSLTPSLVTAVLLATLGQAATVAAAADTVDGRQTSAEALGQMLALVPAGEYGGTYGKNSTCSVRVTKGEAQLDVFVRSVYVSDYDGDEYVSSEQFVYTPDQELTFERRDSGRSEEYELASHRELLDEDADPEFPEEARLDEYKQLEITLEQGRLTSLTLQYYLVNQHSDPSDSRIDCANLKKSR